MPGIESDLSKLAFPLAGNPAAKAAGAARAIQPGRSAGEFLALRGPLEKSRAAGGPGAATRAGERGASGMTSPEKALAGAKGGDERAGLLAASREFEALFLRYLAGAMRQTIPEGGLGGAPGAHFFGGMIDEHLGRLLAESGRGMQLADQLSRQVAALPKEENDGTP